MFRFESVTPEQPTVLFLSKFFSYEFVHFIENFNPVWYNELRRVVFDHLENADELIAREAAATGKDYEYASREVVAEALTDILADSSFIEDFASNHKNIFEKLHAKLKEFVANIKAHFASLTPNTNKATNELKQSGKYFEDIVKAFDKAALGAEYNALFDKVYAFCENAGIIFDVVPIIRNEQGNEVPGVNSGDRVSFNLRSFNSTKVDNEYKSKVILHEMLHAATTYAMIKYYKIRKGDATVNMPKNIYDSCMEINRVFNAIKKNQRFKDEYGLKNGAEMVAELSNPVFVEKLRGTYPTMWHELLDYICRLFGINKSFTNYAKLKKAVDEILTHPDYQLAKEYFIGDGKTTHYLGESQYSDADVQQQRRDGRMSDQEVLAYAVEAYESDPGVMGELS